MVGMANGWHGKWLAWQMAGMASGWYGKWLAWQLAGMTNKLEHQICYQAG
jgi:hypothetical protein